MLKTVPMETIHTLSFPCHSSLNNLVYLGQQLSVMLTFSAWVLSLAQTLNFLSPLALKKLSWRRWQLSHTVTSISPPQSTETSLSRNLLGMNRNSLCCSTGYSSNKAGWRDDLDISFRSTRTRAMEDPCCECCLSALDTHSNGRRLLHCSYFQRCYLATDPPDYGLSKGRGVLHVPQRMATRCARN